MHVLFLCHVKIVKINMRRFSRPLQFKRDLDILKKCWKINSNSCNKKIYI